MLASKYANDAGKAGLDGVDYISRECVPKPSPGGAKLLRRDPAPEILRGDPALARAAIRMAPGKLQYRSLLLSFAPEDIDVDAFNAGAPGPRIAVDHMLWLYREIAFAGVPEKYRPPLFVTTHTHTGRLEVNVIVPRWVTRPDGVRRAFNPDPPRPGSRKIWNTFEDLLNARFGWSNPRDPGRQRLVELPNWILKERAAAERSGDARDPGPREILANALIAAVDAGEVRNREEVIEWLEGWGFENGMVVRAVGARYITVDPASKIPRTAGVKPHLAPGERGSFPSGGAAERPIFLAIQGAPENVQNGPRIASARCAAERGQTGTGPMTGYTKVPTHPSRRITCGPQPCGCARCGVAADIGSARDKRVSRLRGR